MINSPKSSLKREDFMVKSENQFLELVYYEQLAVRGLKSRHKHNTMVSVD